MNSVSIVVTKDMTFYNKRARNVRCCSNGRAVNVRCSVNKLYVSCSVKKAGQLMSGVLHTHSLTVRCV